MDKRNLAQSYDRAQLEDCELVEGEYENEPDHLKLYLLAGLVAVESGVAVAAGWSAGWVMLFLAPLPAAILAGSAWVIAYQIDLPEKYKEIKEKYDALSE
jgi:hypothetical protein